MTAIEYGFMVTDDFKQLIVNVIHCSKNKSVYKINRINNYNSICILYSINKLFYYQEIRSYNEFVQYIHRMKITAKLLGIYILDIQSRLGRFKFHTV